MNFFPTLEIMKANDLPSHIVVSERLCGTSRVWDGLLVGKKGSWRRVGRIGDYKNIELEP